MTKFHNTPKGPARCTATKKACPIGGDHYESQADAQKAYEVSNQDKTLPTAAKRNIMAFNNGQEAKEYYSVIDVSEIKGSASPHQAIMKILTDDPSGATWQRVNQELKTFANKTRESVRDLTDSWWERELNIYSESDEENAKNKKIRDKESSEFAQAVEDRKIKELSYEAQTVAIADEHENWNKVREEFEKTRTTMFRNNGVPVDNTGLTRAEYDEASALIAAGKAPIGRDSLYDGTPKFAILRAANFVAEGNRKGRNLEKMQELQNSPEVKEMMKNEGFKSTDKVMSRLIGGAKNLEEAKNIITNQDAQALAKNHGRNEFLMHSTQDLDRVLVRGVVDKVGVENAMKFMRDLKESYSGNRRPSLTAFFEAYDKL